MDQLTQLENKSIFILREAYSSIKDLGMLWSIGKDSTVLLWLTRKAFFGHVPFPLIHVDTSFKIPEMIEYRNKLAVDWKLDLIVAQNDKALAEKQTFPAGALDRLSCCKALKTEPLRAVVAGTANRYRINQDSGKLEPDTKNETFNALIAGIRADEEGTRSKERYFSPRSQQSQWDVSAQPPEFWNQYNTDTAPGVHVRVHPLLDWTELNIWEYIHREKIPTVSVYYDQGDGKRYRSLGCYPCTSPIESTAKSPADIIVELTTGHLAKLAERSGRAQDKDGGGLEELRKDGYM